MTTHAHPASTSAHGEERICFLFRHFDRAGLDAVMTLSNRGALWVRRRPWSPRLMGSEPGFVTSRAPLEDILEVHARPHRPFQRWATVGAAVIAAVLAIASAAEPALVALWGGIALSMALTANFWPPVLVIVARAGKFSYRGPWSLKKHTIAEVEKALREVVAWSRQHGVPLAGGVKPISAHPERANPICIEITSFSPSASAS